MQGEMFYGVELYSQPKPINPEELSTPDFGWMALLVDRQLSSGGGQNPIDLIELFKKFAEELSTAVNQVKQGEKISRLFVPDIWHITKGREGCFQKEEAEYLYKVQVFATNLARQFCAPHSSPEREFNYPGMLYQEG